MMQAEIDLVLKYGGSAVQIVSGIAVASYTRGVLGPLMHSMKELKLQVAALDRRIGALEIAEATRKGYEAGSHQRQS